MLLEVSEPIDEGSEQWHTGDQERGERARKMLLGEAGQHPGDADLADGE